MVPINNRQIECCHDFFLAHLTPWNIILVMENNYRLIRADQTLLYHCIYIMQTIWKRWPIAELQFTNYITHSRLTFFFFLRVLH